MSRPLFTVNGGYPVRWTMARINPKDIKPIYTDIDFITYAHLSKDDIIDPGQKWYKYDYCKFYTKTGNTSPCFVGCANFKDFVGFIQLRNSWIIKDWHRYFYTHNYNPQNF